MALTMRRLARLNQRARLSRPARSGAAPAEPETGEAVEIPTAPAEWYARSYPKGPAHDHRCLAVLASWQAVHNIHPAASQGPDGGFRACGTGVEIRVRNAHLATNDFDELTRLVVAAHRYRCRVEVSAQMNLLVIRVHPRASTGGSAWECHPGLKDLVARARAA